MRRDHHLVQPEQRRVGGGLHREDVERRAGEAPVLERLRQRLLVDDPPARGVHEAGAVLHHRELVRPDQSLLCPGSPAGGSTRSRTARGATRAWASRRRPAPSPARADTYGSNAITRMPKPCARDATSVPTRPSPISPMVLPASSTPSHRSRSHRPAWSSRVRLRDVASLREQERHRVLGRADRVGLRRVHDHDPAAGGGLDVDVVDADAGAGDHLEARRRLEDLGGHAASRSGSRARRTGAISAARSPCARSSRTSTWNRSRSSSRPASESFSVTRTRTRGRRLLEDALGRRHGRAPLHGMAEPFEGHLQGGEAADDVELAEVPEVPDPEDLPLQRSLPGGEDAAEVRADPVADRVGVDPLGSADRRDGPVVLEALAEQVEAERLHALLHRARQELVAAIRRVDPVLEVQLERRVRGPASR